MSLNKFDSEVKVHERIAARIRRDYPGVVFHTDFGAGLKLPIWLAARQRRLQYKRGFPDLAVFEPAKAYGHIRHGLMIEIKKADIALKRRNGNWAYPHYEEQFNLLSELHGKGYACAFARGEQEAMLIMQWYLEGNIELDFDDFIVQNVINDLDKTHEEF